MGDLISAELQFLRKNLIKRLNNNEYSFTFEEMVTLINLVNDCLKAGNGSILYLLSVLHNKKMDLYITKLLFIKRHLVNNKSSFNMLNDHQHSR
jgi:hypothetical protein